jgi:hypothetical protein
MMGVLDFLELFSYYLSRKHITMQFRNHQLYLAERTLWLDRHVEKYSKRALMKIEALRTCEHEDLNAIRRLVKTSLLDEIPNETILKKEGWFETEIRN